MTEDFSKRYDDAIAKATYNLLKKREEQAKKNIKYIDMYIDLVMKLYESFDWDENKFNIDKVKKEMPSSTIDTLIGKPAYIDININNDHLYATLKMTYNAFPEDAAFSDYAPGFIRDDEFNFDVINDMLAENNISIDFNNTYDNEKNYVEYIIKFDIGRLIAAKPAEFKKKKF